MGPVFPKKTQFKRCCRGLAGAVCLLAGLSVAHGATGAGQVNGIPGSPGATTTIAGNQLPPPPPKFGGKIERNAEQSTPWWPARLNPTRQAIPGSCTT